ncbi:MAG: spermidine/putrescine ABC transporter substrate-binding protein [Chloroflexi bacterium]|jgi:spermidine/putrescine transport system substrate-binding protein|uniref:Spermidine/putrescine ABC transporter substrate-binding protein n=1 Tax=Candidatus Thermofonsia Clade 3 bacterium TaxID=2364212 RepID=A0A2M8QGG4_9CHLR|nr:spermidine/putrescine ABC transporter substrate-binding protein [Candidatus Roseilinea sp. NK_OTU-006]PJF48911.1 MAG: spermidine/putrescine ABC transporter substrate-binding protein [Candidatus Thermofonsia Clade 3 bacterium]RMG66073.1 MAG: spermidine/putrescine ABC transporter substrate-binding protein [Chloroflexota bacterium]
MNRRTFLRLGLGLSGATALMAACGGATAPAPTSAPAADEPAPQPGSADAGNPAKEISWYTWGGYVADSVIDKFKQEFGVTVKIDIYSSNEEMEAKFKAGGNPGYDLITPSDYMVSKLIAAGLLEKLNFGNIPNFQYIDAGHKNLYFDPTNEYSVAYNWGCTGFAYNKTKVTEPITNWKQVMNWPDALKGKLGMLDDVRELLAVGLRVLGYSGNASDPKEINAARDALIELKRRTNYTLTDSPNAATNLVAGDTFAAQIYTNDAVTARSENPDLVYVIPGDVSTVWQDNLCVPKGAPSQYTAEVFINFLCRTDIAAENANEVGLATPSAEALRQGLIAKELVEDKAVYPDVAAMGDALEFLRKGNPEVDELYQRAFDEIKAA